MEYPFVKVCRVTNKGKTILSCVTASLVNNVGAYQELLFAIQEFKLGLEQMVGHSPLCTHPLPPKLN